jgi:heat-inducible transcriptional repressor
MVSAKVVRESDSRKKRLLNIIVKEYITTASPVASETIQRKYKLGVSPATVRNDMADLEKEGYIARPHTSAGCIPLDKAYRHYVENLSRNLALPVNEQQEIRNMFLEATEELDRWLKLAVALMSKLVGSAALVTLPRAKRSRFKHMELVSLHDFMALIVLVMNEASLKQHLLTFSKPMAQDKLSSIANKLNAKYSGFTRHEIKTLEVELGAEEKMVTDAVIDIMSSEEGAELDESYFDGLRLMLSQPEFTKQERMLRILELMEARDWFKTMLKHREEDKDVKVVIGEESGDQSLKDLSLVFSNYGIPRRIGGTVGVIGPTRMDYGRAISAVGYISEILSYLLGEVYSED